MYEESADPENPFAVEHTIRKDSLLNIQNVDEVSPFEIDEPYYDNSKIDLNQLIENNEMSEPRNQFYVDRLIKVDEMSNI